MGSLPALLALTATFTFGQEPPAPPADAPMDVAPPASMVPPPTPPAGPVPGQTAVPLPGAVPAGAVGGAAPPPWAIEQQLAQQRAVMAAVDRTRAQLQAVLLARRNYRLERASAALVSVQNAGIGMIVGDETPVRLLSMAEAELSSLALMALGDGAPLEADVLHQAKKAVGEGKKAWEKHKGPAAVGAAEAAVIELKTAIQFLQLPPPPIILPGPGGPFPGGPFPGGP